MHSKQTVSFSKNIIRFIKDLFKNLKKHVSGYYTKIVLTKFSIGLLILFIKPIIKT